jgi:hypothetical protein
VNNRRFSAEKINWASGLIATANESESDRWDNPLWDAVSEVGAWRAAHQYPVNFMQGVLTDYATSINTQSLVASRLKRFRTIADKCSRLPRGVTLWDMQDVGGLRAVLDTPEQVYALEQRLIDEPPDRFKFEWRNDYIRKPKSSGYRSVHRVYSYEASTDRDSPLHGLKIEVQIRTRLQHAWATTNEIVGAFRREDLKSGRGNPEWQRYFALTGSMIAQIEHGPLGANVPQELAALEQEFIKLDAKLNAFGRLTAYRSIPKTNSPEMFGEMAGVGFAVVSSDHAKRKSDIAVFSPDIFSEAEADYRAKEQAHANDPQFDVVLVFLENLSLLTQAYPNYFADTRDFLRALYVQGYQ